MARNNAPIQTIQEGLGAYTFTPLVAQFIQFMLKNKHEGLLLVDENARVAFMDRYSEKFFGLPPGGAQNRPIVDIISDSPLLEVLQSGEPQIWKVKEVKNRQRIVSRYPIYMNGKVAGAAVKVITHELDEIVRLSRIIKQLQVEIFSYKRDLNNINLARYNFHDILGISKSILKSIETAKRIARTDSNTLITGESGTGKELFAHSIHQASSRADGPFIRVNCAAIPFNLAESELFGYVRGAFTGSIAGGQKGKFELASGGTIFLDEISSMPLATQAILLRVIEEKEVQPLGSSRPKSVDFRVIAATNLDLEKLAKKGSFRSDLYYRLSTMPCPVAPLRERPEDIAFLARRLLEDINRKLTGNVQSIEQDALEILLDYEWPGNVRELINVLEQAVLNAAQTDKIRAEMLPAFLQKAFFWDLDGSTSARTKKGIQSAVEEAERKAIAEALEATGGNKKKAADLLGISRTTLYQKLHRLSL